MKQPSQCPDYGQIENALEGLSVLDDVKLHFYQLLYFHSPQLTSPGVGSPFDVTLKVTSIGSLYHLIFFDFTRQVFDKSFNTEGLSFSVSFSKLKDEESVAEIDKEVLRKCSLIMDAYYDKKQWVSGNACCCLAKLRGCVCRQSFTCELHGIKCIGSHD